MATSCRGWRYSRGMKKVGAAVAAVALMAVPGCGSSSDVSPAESETAAPGYTWQQFREDYPLLTKPCSDHETNSAKIACWGVRDATIKSAKSNAEQLPASKDRGTLLSMFDNFTEKKREFNAELCDATRFDDVDCMITINALSSFDTVIVNLVTKTGQAAAPG